MATNIGLLYVAAITLLFFFWVYGIGSFVLDLKNTYIPLGQQYVRGRREQRREQEREEEREERERQLY